MLNVKEGQTYVCKCDDDTWWTLNKEYKIFSGKYNDLAIMDDDNDKWYATSSLMNKVFKLKEETFKLKEETFDLKEKTFDLNKLTISELDEYVDLQQALELAKNDLNAFIERMSK